MLSATDRGPSERICPLCSLPVVFRGTPLVVGEAENKFTFIATAQARNVNLAKSEFSGDLNHRFVALGTHQYSQLTAQTLEWLPKHSTHYPFWRPSFVV